MDHDAAREAAIAAHLPDPALAGEWQRLEALHYDEYAAGRISFTEQRRRRVRGIHAAMSRAEPADDACDAWFAAYLEHYRAGWSAFDDVLPALGALAAARPGRALGIVTNGEGEPQRAKLAAIGLADRFPVVVASAEVGSRSRTRRSSRSRASGSAWRPTRPRTSATGSTSTRRAPRRPVCAGSGSTVPAPALRPSPGSPRSRRCTSCRRRSASRVTRARLVESWRIDELVNVFNPPVGR